MGIHAEICSKISIFLLLYQLSLLTGSNTLQIQITMADMPDMAPIFIKQYPISLYITEVLIVWDSRILMFYLDRCS